MKMRHYIVEPGSSVDLKDYPTDSTGDFKDKKDAERKLADDVSTLAKVQDLLYSNSRYALLVILQGLDTSGKDGVIKHVMSGLNPQGVQVTTFGAPSAEEIRHDYLWRCARALPANATNSPATTTIDLIHRMDRKIRRSLSIAHPSNC